MVWLAAYGVSAVVFGGFGAWIAGQKNRDANEGAVLGGLFGPIGVIVEALLPTRSTEEARRASPTVPMDKPDPGPLTQADFNSQLPLSGGVFWLLVAVVVLGLVVMLVLNNA